MIDRITSTSNAKIKAIRALRIKKNRTESSLFLAEGIRLVTEAVQKRMQIESIVFCPDMLRSDVGLKTVQIASKSGMQILEVNSVVFETISSRDNPQGLIAVIKEKWETLEGIKKNLGIWVGLDAIQDAGNLGSIMRSLDAFCGKGIILIGECADPYQITTVRASMGSIFSLDIIKTSVSDFLAWNKGHNVPIIGTWIGDSKNYREVAYPHNGILLMGSEQKGLRKELLTICTQRVMIPMKGTVDSLNVSCAMSIILAEIFAQHEVENDQ